MSTKVGIRKARPREQKKNVLVTGFKIRNVGFGEYYGFTIDGDHLYCDAQFFVHHNSGKSLVIAAIAKDVMSPLLIFQPSKEILEQNYEKMVHYGIRDVGVYSASLGIKERRKITLATIGSVNNHLEDFRLYKYVIVDESHNINAKGGMYERFIHDRPDRCVVGLTATPYRLSRSFDGGSELKFLTRTRPRIFSDVLYYCQISDLICQGYLADLRYFDVSNRVALDLGRVRTNTTGSDYDDKSLQLEIERSGFAADLENWVLRTLKPKDGSKRNGILVFTRFVAESNHLIAKLQSKGIRAAVVTADTTKRERERVVKAFKAHEIDVVSNAGVFATGFDYPELDTVILARPTKSLALYYQQVGRAIRPCEGKKGWIVDLVGNYRRFGAVSDLKIECPFGTHKWMITSKGRQLTNIPF